MIACLDTGCVMTIPDAALELAEPLVEEMHSDACRRIRHRPLIDGVCDIPNLLSREDNAACIPVESHLVESLGVKPLITMDVMVHVLHGADASHFYAC